MCGLRAVVRADGEPGLHLQQRSDPRLQQLQLLRSDPPLQLRRDPVRDRVQLRHDGVRYGLLYRVCEWLLDDSREAAKQLQVQGQGLCVGDVVRLHSAEHAVFFLQQDLRERGRDAKRLLLHQPVRDVQRHLGECYSCSCWVSLLEGRVGLV